MTRLLTAAFALALGAASIPAEASGSAVAAGACPALGAPLIRYDIAYGDVLYDYRLSGPEIAALARREGSGESHGGQSLGLTVAPFRTDYETETAMRDVSGAICGYPRLLSLHIGYGTFTIYVDRRFGPGSCARQAVLDHEQEHVRIFRAALAQYEPAIKRAVGTYLRAHPAIMVQSPDEAQSAYLAGINRVLEPVFTKMSDTANAGHAALDSPASVERTRLSCADWS